MKRRDTLRLFKLSVAGSVIGLPMFSSCKNDNYIPELFTTTELQSLTSIADTIIPATADAPGAAELKVGNFIDKYCKYCLDEGEQNKLKSGIAAFQANVKNKIGQAFKKLETSKREQYLEAQLASEDEFISDIKSLVLFTYFTSKEAMTNMLDYVQTPGRYEGDIAYQANQKDGE